MKVAIILGNRMNDDGTLSELCLKRIELTKEINERLNPDKIILSGGMPNEKAKIAEADAMYAKLSADGFDMSKIVVENKSNTTKENAKFAIPIADKLGADEVIVCSTLEHVGRWYFNPIPTFQKEMANNRKMRLTFYVGE